MITKTSLSTQLLSSSYLAARVHRNSHAQVGLAQFIIARCVIHSILIEDHPIFIYILMASTFFADGSLKPRVLFLKQTKTKVSFVSQRDTRLILILKSPVCKHIRDFTQGHCVCINVCKQVQQLLRDKLGVRSSNLMAHGIFF